MYRYLKIVPYVLTLFLCIFVSAYYDDDEIREFKLTANVGDYIVFNCKLDFPQGYPIPYKLIWKKGDEEIFTYQEGMKTQIEKYRGRIILLDRERLRYFGHNKNVQYFGGASINLTHIQESDAGWYQCRTMFPTRTPPFRNNGTWFHLSVSAGNLLAIPPMNQTEMEGDEVRFRCVVKDYSYRVRWLKDNIPLSELPDLSSRSFVERDGTLVIKPSDMGDSGEYECEASNNEGDKQTARAYLNVQYKAKVLYAPPEVFLPFGQPAILDCHYRSNPPLTNVRWDKDGFLYDPFNIQGVFHRKNGSLYIEKVDDSHAGSFTCTPFNDLGTSGPSPVIHVIVQKAPVFTRLPHNLYLKKLGETVTLPCEARDGDQGHQPSVTWSKKDSALPFGRSEIKNGNLTIFDIQEDDRGLYECTATNRAATVTTETELLVENIPSSAPYNLTAISSPNSIHLKWMSRRSMNVEYSIWYKKIEHTEWKTYLVPSSRALEATIINLDPATEYELMVLSRDDTTDGSFSKTIRVWTKHVEEATDYRGSEGGAPIGHPRNIQLKPTDEGILVTWEPPLFGMERLKGYIVRWSQGPDDSIFGSDGTRDNSYLIRNLFDGSEYNIQVIAVTFDDQQMVSEKIRALYPGFKSIRAISTGIIGGLGIICALFVVIYAVRKKWCKKQYDQENVKK